MEPTALLRAEWLAQLADAIEGAQRLAWQFGTHHAKSAEARELYGRLEAVRLELNSLRGAERQPAVDIEPNWLELLGWSGRPSDPAD